MRRIAVSLVVQIAELELRRTGIAQERNTNHSPRVAGVKRPGDDGFVRGENHGVDANSESESQNSHGGEAGISVQHARAISQVLDQDAQQGHWFLLMRCRRFWGQIAKVVGGWLHIGKTLGKQKTLRGGGVSG